MNFFDFDIELQEKIQITEDGLKDLLGHHSENPKTFLAVILEWLEWQRVSSALQSKKDDAAVIRGLTIQLRQLAKAAME